MSHAHGEVYKDGVIVGHFEYNGTVDVAYTKIQPTAREVNRFWRSPSGANDAECRCGQPPEDVILYTDYGSGYHWPATACLRCKAIVSGLDPYEQDDRGWPIHGRPPGPKEAPR